MWVVKNGIHPNELEKTLNALAADGLIVRNIWYTARTFAVVAFREPTPDSKKTLRELCSSAKTNGAVNGSAVPR
jgi:DNA-binding HxlR family transcriptional regulator